MRSSPPLGAPDPAPLKVRGGGAHRHQSLRHTSAQDLPFHLQLADMDCKLIFLSFNPDLCFYFPLNDICDQSEISPQLRNILHRRP